MDYFTERIISICSVSKTITVQRKEDLTKEILDEFKRSMSADNTSKGKSAEEKTVK